ncbi:hypothetical protein Q0M94_15540 [Deinococcus radiomollis]|uniref:hypothetical protein n=1 Tax=Deinococcus radiomollis TaxID=468916 RepID=UPI003892BB38
MTGRSERPGKFPRKNAQNSSGADSNDAERGQAEQSPEAPAADAQVTEANTETIIVRATPAQTPQPAALKLQEPPQPFPGQPDLSSEDNLEDPSEPLLVIPELTTMFPSGAPFLARFLPQVPATVLGLNASFCNLHDFLRHLHDVGWYGYLHAFIGDQAAFVLVYEGRTVAAASISSTGEQALGELLHLYEQGAPLSAYALPPHLAHILSGVGSRAWKFNLTEDFTGLHARPRGAIFYSRGEIVATMPATLPYEGAFPAPLRPQTLILPRSLAGWAHGQYGLTLRGKDALNAITSVHQNFRSQYGVLGLAFLRALSEKLSPAEYAMRSDVALHDLEPLLQEFLRTGVAKEQMAGQS